MDEKRTSHHKVTFTVVMAAVTLIIAIAMDGAEEVITWHVYACLALTCAIPCFVVWRI
jgi:hypothetical protein